MSIYKQASLAAAFAIVALLISGCAGENQVADKAADGTNTTVSIDDHSGWWCVPHAIPEEECSMCSSKVAAECKEKGDWCEEHNRAKSQCFKCDPSLADKYAKLYEAKFGEKPPAAID